MKKKIFKRGMAGLLAVLTAFTTLIGMGTTAFAASETAESYMVSYPRDGDAVQVYDHSTWGHDAKTYMNGWSTGASNMTTIHCMDSYDGKVCYCIEPGVPRNVGDSYSGFGENFWDNYPSQYNNTIEPDDIKVLLGRIMQYGYQGNISTSWKSQTNGDEMAHAIATQLLVWETVIGERDADFNHVSTGGKDAVKSVIGPNHPLKSKIDSYYNSIVSSVQSHVEYPSFMSKSTGKATTIELEWDGSKYVAELTDTNNVLSKFTFSASATGFNFSVSGNKLTITTDNAPTGDVTITASRSVARCGVLVWTDNKYGPDGGIQDTVTYTASVSDPVKAFIKLKVSYGSAKIIKTSEDGKVDGIKFTVVGDGVNQTVTTNSKGEIQIDNLMPGTYTVTEQTYDKYVPQETHRVTVLAGQTATVSFNNVLRRGDLTVTKTSEDGLVEGVKFHLYGTSVSGLAVDEFAVTNSKGIATFKDVLIGSGYTLEEVDTAIRYVVPASQSAAVEWNSVTNKSFSNILKKFNVTVTKSDYETGTAQGDASLAGATYGIYKGDQLVDTYVTDKNGQFITSYYVCGDDWSIKEIEPSEGYLLDNASYHVGAEAKLYTVERNSAPAVDVTEQVQKGNIAIIKHTDDGETKIETPEEGVVFAIYLKSSGSFDAAKETERDYLTCNENGFAQSKDKQFGMDIETVKSTQNKYHLVSREFDIAELKLLIDAVESSKFISAKKSEQLVAKISKFAGSHKGNELKRNIFPEGRIKSVNEQILLIVDAVNEAINSNKKIAFQYYQYNVRKEKKVKNDGDQYVFSPYYLVWNGDYYYMVGYSDKHKNIGSFRIDRICKQPRVLGTDAVPKPEDFDINEYLNTMFRMYNSERCTVELVCDNSVMDAIIDRFGEDVRTYANNMNTFRAEVEIAANHVFYSWVFGFGGRVKIKSPENVKAEYAQMVKEAAENLEA